MLQGLDIHARFWINDDDDGGDAGGSDIPKTPASKGTNGYDNYINGLRDLIDFFPLHLDLQAHLKIYPEGDYDYQFSHPSSMFAPCFRIAYAPTLLPTDSEAYLKDIETGNSVQYLQSLPIHSTGRDLAPAFLRQLEQGTGMLLIEAIRPTTEPITLKIINQTTGTTVAETQFHISVTPVTDMFRYKFVHPMAADITQGDMPGDPSNWPDADRNEKHFVFVNGYNVNPDQTKGWGGELFKRLFWSGSNARFTAFAWKGAESQVPPEVPLIGGLSPNYQINLLHAFGTAKSFQQFHDLLEGETTVAAHSMGNIVVGSAMHDYGVRPENYIMLNSAAAKECYDDTEVTDNDQKTRMVHPAWIDYPKEIRASEWHALPGWPEDDKRRTLTWRNSLRGVIENGGQTDVYNFYSSGEDVLNNPEANNPQIDPENPFGITEIGWTKSNKVWAMQEKRKGYGLTGVIHTSSYGGWAANHFMYDSGIHEISGADPIGYRMKKPSELPSPISEQWLFDRTTTPFFSWSPKFQLVQSDKGAGTIGSNYARDNRIALISEMIPCTTFATGRNPLTALGNDIDHPLSPGTNVDMNTKFKTDPNSWPLTDEFKENDTDAPIRAWLHSDMRGIAYSHNFKLYDKFVEIGNLKSN